MLTSNARLMLGAAACALLLTGCGSDGLTVGASNGAGVSTAGSSQPGSSTDGSGSTSGSGTTTTGTTGTTAGTGGDSGTGSSGGTQAGLLGSGTVTVTAAGTTATTPSSTLLAGTANKVGGSAAPLLTTGNALLPTGAVTGALQPATASLPATATIDNASLGGAATQPVGVSVLSATQAPGSVATVGVASAGQTGTVTVNPSGLAATPVGGAVTSAATTTSGVLNGQSALADVTAAKQDIITGANPLVGASVATPTQNGGSVASVGVLSNNQAATATLGNQPVVNVGTGTTVKKVITTPQVH